MKSLENKIPPPFLVMILGVAMWTFVKFAPVPSVSFAVGSLRLPAAIFFFALAGCVGLPAFVAFRRARTTIDPVNIGRASNLVTGGIYRITRNPMYVGLTALLLAWAFFLESAWAFCGPAIFFIFVTRFQIIPEERIMLTKFGDAYRNYQARVRRWL